MTSTIASKPGVSVRKVSDRTFLLHDGGKIVMGGKTPLRGRDDLSIVGAYGPPADHPTVAGWPEGAYLKFVVLA